MVVRAFFIGSVSHFHSVLLIGGSITGKLLAYDQPLTVNNEFLALSMNMNQPRGTHAKLSQINSYDEAAALAGWNSYS